MYVSSSPMRALKPWEASGSVANPGPHSELLVANENRLRSDRPRRRYFLRGARQSPQPARLGGAHLDLGRGAVVHDSCLTRVMAHVPLDRLLQRRYIVNIHCAKPPDAAPRVLQGDPHNARQG